MPELKPLQRIKLRATGSNGFFIPVIVLSYHTYWQEELHRRKVAFTFIREKLMPFYDVGSLFSQRNPSSARVETIDLTEARYNQAWSAKEFISEGTFLSIEEALTHDLEMFRKVARKELSKQNRGQNEGTQTFSARSDSFC